METARAIRVVAVLLLVLGTAVFFPRPALAASVPASASQDVMHEILPGDCLHLIAGYYYGDARLWERIWEANRQVVRNPNVLASGALLVVPDAGVPPEPYPDFTARAIGCGPAGTARAAAQRVEGKAKGAPPTPAPPSKAR
jgi:hypothetical protein